MIGRYPSEAERFVLSYPSVADRPIHMVGVRRPLMVTWLADGEVTKQTVARPWVGGGSATADTIIEERPTEEQLRRYRE